MWRNKIGFVMAALLLVALGIAAWLNRQPPGTSTPYRSAQDPATPAPDRAAPSPTWIFPDTGPTHTPDPLRSPTPSPPPGDAFPMETMPTPIPTPNIDVTTVPELDRIAFVNPRPLNIESGYSTLWGIAWSPNGKYFAGFASSSEYVQISENTGEVKPLLYLVKADTGEATLWQLDAGYPAWSQDGNSLYYMALRAEPRADGYSDLYWDLYKRPLDANKGHLIAQNVDRSALCALSGPELTDGRLLAHIPGQGPVFLLPSGNDGEARREPVPLVEILGKQIPSDKMPALFLAPDGRIATVVDALPGDSLPILRLIDLSAKESVAELKCRVHSPGLSLRWTKDGRTVVYATYATLGQGGGIFTYDLDTQQHHTVITAKQLGLPDYDTRPSVEIPYWSPDERIVLFHVVGPTSWSAAAGGPTFIFAATRDGSQWRAVSKGLLEALSPDGTHGIIRTGGAPTEENPLAITQSVVDVVWQ